MRTLSAEPLCSCWHFAQELTDMAEARGEQIIPLGLVSSQWGGTMIQHWVPNSTLNAQACLNSTGGAYAPSQNQRWDIDSGALFNGMVRPWLQFTIKGALWYQGMLSSPRVASSSPGRVAPSR